MATKKEIRLTELQELSKYIEELCQIWFLGEYDPAVNRTGKKENKRLIDIILANILQIS